MSYFKRQRALGGLQPPDWYRAMGSISSQPQPMPVSSAIRGISGLGSLGADPDTTLSTPTLDDPTRKWQQDVLAQLQAGVLTMKHAELQKWLQIAATLSIPVATFLWKTFFPRLFPKGSASDV